MSEAATADVDEGPDLTWWLCLDCMYQGHAIATERHLDSLDHTVVRLR